MSKFNLKEIQEIQEYITKLFPQYIYVGSDKEKLNDSYVCFSNIGSNHQYMFKVEELFDIDKLSKIFKNFKKENLGMTFNSFAHCKSKNRNSGLFGVQTLVVDIDYKTTEYENADSVLYFLEEEYFGRAIPAPNYIEYGNQMRLIYILKEPVKFRHRMGADLRNFVQFVNNFFTNKLNEFGADVQGLNSYIRLPHSINTKHKKNQVVRVEKYSDEIFKFQDLVDEFLPDLPSWYKPKSERKKKKKISNVKNLYVRHTGLLSDLEKLQAYYNEFELEGHREICAYLYRNYCLLIGLSKEEAKEKMLEFNKNWNVPLIEKKLLSATNNVNRKTYIYSNQALMNLLNLDEELCQTLNLTEIHIRKAYTKEERKEYNHNYYMKHIRKSRKMTRKQLTQKIKNIVLLAKKEGKTNKVIQTILDYYYKIKLSVKSIERYVHTLISEGLYSPH